MMAPLNTVAKTGSLLKKNPKGVGWWKKRHFVLQGHKLLYFDKAGDSEPKGLIFLENYELHCSQGVSTRLGKKFSFELS